MIDPNEMDSHGFGPQQGHPVLRLPDGRRLAISTWELPIGLSGIGAMVYEVRHGLALWGIQGDWHAKWQSVAPTPSVPDDQVLSKIIEAQGGPANFIINAMATGSRELAKYLGFVPQWPAPDSLTILNQAMGSWGLKSILPASPAVLVLPYPK